MTSRTQQDEEDRAVGRLFDRSSLIKHISSNVASKTGRAESDVRFSSEADTKAQ